MKCHPKAVQCLQCLLAITNLICLQVVLNMESRWLQEEDIAMSIDCGEEDWRRLHDIRLDGQVLEYVGRGKSLIDVGLAQARTPLCTRTHYFEIGKKNRLLSP